MNSIDVMLDRIDSVVQENYAALIKIHENARLKGLCAKEPIYLSSPRATWEHLLGYGKNGFYVGLAKFYPGGDWSESGYCGYYDRVDHAFQARDGTLVAKAGKTEYTLLGLFPDVNPETIEQKICEHIERMPLFKNAKRAGSK